MASIQHIRACGFPSFPTILIVLKYCLIRIRNVIFSYSIVLTVARSLSIRVCDCEMKTILNLKPIFQTLNFNDYILLVICKVLVCHSSCTLYMKCLNIFLKKKFQLKFLSDYVNIRMSEGFKNNPLPYS